VEKRRNSNGGCGRAAVRGPSRKALWVNPPAAGGSETSKKNAKLKPAIIEVVAAKARGEAVRCLSSVFTLFTSFIMRRTIRLPGGTSAVV